ncbi:MAG: HesA/MoeB/ThiF family protein [Bacteroidales bacterium]|jgi:adenylyltransferase/sulfurtransferase
MESLHLSQREIRRYGKQIMLPEVGLEGQEKLKKASVLVVGAGGLGSPVLQYLAAAGTGKIGIIEFDKVDETNLQRQVLYGSHDVGKLKSIIVRERLEHLNSLVKLEIINLRLDSSNSLRIIKDYDVIIDATDNYETRYIINDSCIILDKPMVYGAIYKYEGQISVFNYKGGPTYRCFNPDDHGKILKNPQPADIGLMGVLPGITGTWMANEVIKIITGIGTVLSGKVLVFNTMDNSFRLLSIRNIPENHSISSITTSFLSGR